ncbi:MAG TPA: hydroxymethylglutaryl-CoA reductase, degradative [Firmicutes bacterium]|nr:hydroxymethylglutaryl-CoA reductase, degradative [Bacillota bacterium]
MASSKVSGFYKLSVDERLKFVKEFASLTDDEVSALKAPGALSLDAADRMIENVIGTFQLPLGIAVNFLINQKDYLIPMVVEEPSVVAACSHAAKLARDGGGFFTSSTGPIMIAQIQAVNVIDPAAARLRLLEARDEILELANQKDPVLVELGGGARDIEVRVIEAECGKMVVTHLLVDVRDAMGANAVNTMAEALAPTIERITGGRVCLRILSNLADRRVARARTVVPKESLGGEEVVDGIVLAYQFAAADPYRAATHNKGVMNGVTAVVLATGNDTRAIEAGAHSYAARTGHYGPLTRWEKDKDGNLTGSIELPVAVGLIGGATKVHPVAKIAVKILGCETAGELGEVLAAVGLAQNLAALRVLATEGIQRGHMALHARNVAVTAGATGELVDKVAEAMVRAGKIRIDYARELIREMS